MSRGLGDVYKRQHHLRVVNPATGMLMGAMTDQQAQRVQDLVGVAGVPIEYRSFPEMGHAMHDIDPQIYIDTVVDWVGQLGT